MKRPQRTIDNTREKDETMVTAEDVEVFEDEDVDEFAPHYDGKVIPRVLLTTSQTPSRALRNTMRILRYVTLSRMNSILSFQSKG